MDIKEAVKLIEGKVVASQEKMAEAVDTVKKDFDKEKAVFVKQVEDVNTELAKKDATIKEIQAEVIELKAKGGRTKAQDDRKMNLKDMIGEQIEKQKDEFIKIADQSDGLIKAMTFKNISTSSLSANFITYLSSADGMEPLGQIRLRDMCRVIHSETDNVSYPIADNPVGTGSFGRQTEAATKAQVNRTYTMKTLVLKAMAGFAIASRQSLRNILFLQQWLPTSMMEQLLDSEDLDFSATLVAAAAGDNTANNRSGSALTVPVEKIIAWIRNNIKAKYNPTGIALDPAAWSDILITKPNDYSLPNAVTIDANGNTRILGRPLYPVNWLNGSRAIVGDWSKTAVVQSEGLTVRQTDSHASIFTSNETAFLLERTEGLAVFRTDAFITGIV